MNNNEFLRVAGAAIYGPNWQGPLATALGVNDRTMRRWQLGEMSPPTRVLSDIRQLILERIGYLHEVEAALRELEPEAQAERQRLAERKAGPEKYEESE